LKNVWNFVAHRFCAKVLAPSMDNFMLET